MEYMFQDYYRLRGWSEAGIPGKGKKTHCRNHRWYFFQHIQKDSLINLLESIATSIKLADGIDSVQIANALQLTVSETKQILKTMHDMGDRK